MAVFLFNGVGKPLISDESIREQVSRARAKVARVSERTPEPTPIVPALVIDATTPDEGIEEQLAQEDQKRYMKLCRVLMYGMRGGGHDVGTPRAALVTSLREAYKHRRKWRLNVTRQPGEADEGSGRYRTDELLTMATMEGVMWPRRRTSADLGPRKIAGTN